MIDAPVIIVGEIRKHAIEGTFRGGRGESAADFARRTLDLPPGTSDLDALAAMRREDLYLVEAAASAAAASAAANGANASAEQAGTSASVSSAAAAAAAASAGVAGDSASTALAQVALTSASASAAAGSASAANTSEGLAQSHAIGSGNNATASQASRLAAESARDSALGSAEASASHSSSASSSASSAQSSAAAADSARLLAITARGGAESARDTAISARDTATSSAAQASSSAQLSAGSSTTAGQSASAAASSAQAASSSASAASTSASASETSRIQADSARGQAQVAAGGAATSQTNAAGSASTASSSAGVSAAARDQAAGYRDTAGASATAAAASASSASASRTAAETAASAAASSSIAAAAAFTDAVVLTGNPYFDQGSTGWTPLSSGTVGSVAPALGGRPNVMTGAAGSTVQMSGDRKTAFDPSRKYRVRGWYWTGAGGGGSQLYMGFRAFDAALSPLAHNPGSYAYVAATGVVQPAGAGWVEYVSDVIVPQSTGTYGYPPGTAAIAPLVLANYNRSATPFGLDSLYIEDCTESVAAAQAAAAAATSASSASASSGSAGSSANSASSSSQVAGTHASDALSYRNAAVNASSGAAGSASSASTSAGIAASVSTGSLLRNARFTEFPASPGVPTGWSDWSSGTGHRVDNPAGGFSYRHSAAAGQSAGIVNYSPPGSTAQHGYYVIEAELTLVAGSLLGASLYAAFYNDATTASYETTGFLFQSDVPVGADAAPGGGVVGRTYRYAKLYRVANAGATRPLIYAMTGWTGYTGTLAAKTLDWHKVSIRPATAAEIAAGVALPALQASVSTTQSTVANLAANYALARYQVAATTPGGAAILSLTSSNYGAVAGLQADQIYFGENTFFDNASDTLQTVDGSGRMVTAWGAGFGNDGTLREWHGPADVALSAMSRANAFYGRASVEPRVFGSALPTGGGGGGTAPGSGVENVSGYVSTGIYGSSWMGLKNFTLSGIPLNPTIWLNLSFSSVYTYGSSCTVQFQLVEVSGNHLIAGPDGPWEAFTNMGVPPDGVYLNGYGTKHGTVEYQLQGRVTSGSGISNVSISMGFSAVQTI